MQWTLVLLNVLPLALALDTPFGRFLPPHPPHRDDDAAGDPLFLTPYIEAGKLAQGRKLARVAGLDTQVASFAGFLTTNATTQSNMFFWFFPAASQPAEAPTVLWLQGGPGGSSLFGLFVENGPFSVDAGLQLHARNYSWHNTHNMLYVDNPVGTGFSFTRDDSGYADNEADVARDLYSALYQFFTLFEQYRTNDFFITGESYAGKYVPAIAYKIHQENPTAKMKINLKGLAIGDGLCDPINQLNYYGSFLYSIGLVTAADRDAYIRSAARTRQYIRDGDYMAAVRELDRDMAEYTRITGLNMVYNYLLQDTPTDFSYYPNYVTSPRVRASIHVGNQEYQTGSAVMLHLQDDMMHSISDTLERLLDADYRLLFYNGQLDVIIDYVGTQTLVEKLQWRGQAAFGQCGREPWLVDGEVAGYVCHAPPLTLLMVRNAGHILPYDQPKWAYDMVSRFTAGKKFGA